MPTNCAGPVLPAGYSRVPPGHVAAVVTFLEMRQRPEPQSARSLPPGFELVPLTRPTPDRYRTLFRAVGEDWLWFSRIVMRDDELRSIIDDPRVHILALRHGGQDAGILELDFREADACELAFFGLAKSAIGKGIGGALMREAIARAWTQPIERFWLHTCTFDHPSAVAFYRRFGFTPYAFEVEVQADPRLTGAMPRHCAPHVPLLDSGR